jgi:hypothetical protein
MHVQKCLQDGIILTMAYSLHPEDSKRAAFARGFWKGLAAPLVLFSNFNIPEQGLPGEFRPLPRRAPATGSDWVRVGDELRSALKKHKESEARG